MKSNIKIIITAIIAIAIGLLAGYFIFRNKQNINTLAQPQNHKTEVVQTSAKGFAWSGGGRAIIRVDVSANKGLSWQTATLKEGADQPLSKAWAWTFWEIDDLEIDASKLKPGDEIKVLVKAVDASYNAQPEGAAAIWNLRGLNNNSWHAFTVKVEE